MRTHTRDIKHYANYIVKTALLLGYIALLLMTQAATAEDKPVFLETRQLTAESAMKIGSAALEDCTRRGFKVGVSITSREGQLLFFIRHPLAGPHTPMISLAKAYTSSTMGTATSALTEANAQKLNYYDDITTLGGGVPIIVAGHQYGGIGVSGATPEADEECANVGIKTIEEDLEFSE